MLQAIGHDRSSPRSQALGGRPDLKRSRGGPSRHVGCAHVHSTRSQLDVSTAARAVHLAGAPSGQVEPLDAREVYGRHLTRLINQKSGNILQSSSRLNLRDNSFDRDT